MYIVAVKISAKKTELFEFETKKDALAFQKDMEKRGIDTAIATISDDKPQEHWFTARKGK
jgi:hypothetical protein